MKWYIWLIIALVLIAGVSVFLWMRRARIWVNSIDFLTKKVSYQASISGKKFSGIADPLTGGETKNGDFTLRVNPDDKGENIIFTLFKDGAKMTMVKTLSAPLISANYNGTLPRV